MFRRLVAVSDLFVQNSVVGTMERLGFSYDVLSRWNPRFSMISVSGPGQTGPWREYQSYGTTFEGIYGYGSLIGYPDMDADGIPLVAPSDPATGVAIASAAIMALDQREKTGKGCYIDIALGEALAPHFGKYFLDYAHRDPAHAQRLETWGPPEGIPREGEVLEHPQERPLSLAAGRVGQSPLPLAQPLSSAICRPATQGAVDCITLFFSQKQGSL